MGFRFRKSVNLGPVRINLSKSGIGYSVGTKGFRVTKKAAGGTRTTTSIPGTGISYTKDYQKKSKKEENVMAKKSKKKLSGKSIVGGLAALCVIGAISGGGEESSPSSSSSAQGFDNVSASVSSSVADVSQELPGGAEIPDVSTPDVSHEASDPSALKESPSDSNPSTSAGTADAPQKEPAAPVTPVVPAVTTPDNTGNQAEPETKPEAKPETKPEADPEPEPIAKTYIGNKNTKKFHEPSCSSVSDMKEKNKVTLNSRDEAISKGYEPCGRCHP